MTGNTLLQQAGEKEVTTVLEMVASTPPCHTAQGLPCPQDAPAHSISAECVRNQQQKKLIPMVT